MSNVDLGYQNKCKIYMTRNNKINCIDYREIVIEECQVPNSGLNSGLSH